MMIPRRNAYVPLLAALAMATNTLAWTSPALARSAPRPPQVCGQKSLSGIAPDVMTYDSQSGTQVLLNPGPDTQVTAFNARTRSAAHVGGDLGRPGTPESCVVDGTPGGSAYAIQPVGNGVEITGYDGKTGQVWRMDGDGSFARENDCFKAGLGLFAGSRGNMVGVGPAISVGRDSVGVGLAVGDGMAGLVAKDGIVGIGVLTC